MARTGSTVLDAPIARRRHNAADACRCAIDTLCLDDMNVRHTPEPGPKKRRAVAVPAHALQQQEGHRAYLRDLPGLLRAKREGHMVAYRGEERLGISPSDSKLYQMLAKLSNYEQIKTELFITRVTILDAEQHGLRV
jgi:hypothetical protein